MKTRLLLAAAFSLIFFLSMVFVARHRHAALEEIIRKQNEALHAVQAVMKRATK